MCPSKNIDPAICRNHAVAVSISDSFFFQITLFHLPLEILIVVNEFWYAIRINNILSDSVPLAPYTIITAATASKHAQALGAIGGTEKQCRADIADVNLTHGGASPRVLFEAFDVLELIPFGCASITAYLGKEEDISIRIADGGRVLLHRPSSSKFGPCVPVRHEITLLGPSPSLREREREMDEAVTTVRERDFKYVPLFFGELECAVPQRLCELHLPIEILRACPRDGKRDLSARRPLVTDVHPLETRGFVCQQQCPRAVGNVIARPG